MQRSLLAARTFAMSLLWSRRSCWAFLASAIFLVLVMSVEGHEEASDESDMFIPSSIWRYFFNTDRRSGNTLRGSSLGSEFLGRRRKRVPGSEFLGKRAPGSEFLGKRAPGSGKGQLFLLFVP